MPNLSVKQKLYQNEGNAHILRWVPEGTTCALDLGCGAGDNAKHLSKQGVEVDGVTLSEQEAEVARANVRSVFVHNLENGLPPEAADAYDVIIASHVLEHICFPEALLKGVREKLNGEGRFIIALPNLLQLRYRLKLLLGHFEYESGGIMDNTHFRWYTFTSAQRMLEANGFKVIEAYADGYLPLPLIGKIIPDSLRNKLDKMASSIFPGLFGWQMIYVAQKDTQSQ